MIRAYGEPRNFANWPTEFGKIFRGKLRALVTMFKAILLSLLHAINNVSQKNCRNHNEEKLTDQAVIGTEVSMHQHHSCHLELTHAQMTSKTNTTLWHIHGGPKK